MIQLSTNSITEKSYGLRKSAQQIGLAKTVCNKSAARHIMSTVQKQSRFYKPRETKKKKGGSQYAKNNIEQGLTNSESPAGADSLSL
jgi:hypothetical protein